MNKKNISYIYAIISLIILIAFDQYTKYLTVLNLKNNEAIVIIDGIFEFVYVENFGAAFGILQNAQIFFYIVTVIVLSAIIYIYIKMPANKIYLPLKVCMTVLTAGAVGNFIDRVVNGFVVDFIYFKLIDFPVFNIADCYVTVSVMVIAVLICFKYKDEDFEFIKISSKEKAN